MRERAEPDRDERLWAGPRLTLAQIRSLDPSAATDEELVRAAVEALRWGDTRTALRLARVAHARQPGDDLSRALIVWAEVVRRARRGKEPTERQVAELAALAQSSAFALGCLVRALLWRKDVRGARSALESAPAQFRRAPSVMAADALTTGVDGSRSACLRQLRQLRTVWPPALDLLRLEVLIAASCGDASSVEEAYAQLRRLRGRRPVRWLPRVWLRLRGASLLGMGLWALGVAAGRPQVLFVALPLTLASVILDRHMTGRRLLTDLPGLGYLALYWLTVAWLLRLDPAERVGLGLFAATIPAAIFAYAKWRARRYRDER
jgi:hypothetical protein